MGLQQQREERIFKEQRMYCESNSSYILLKGVGERRWYGEGNGIQVGRKETDSSLQSVDVLDYASFQIIEVLGNLSHFG